ncbi:endonuclease and reverse transcriptase activity [Mucor ambiguus]|uniref:Endonuclease and reverse transcriptase activity n=1 Tax=Mucor ambiguus TaxID=91626 RepID=A0A0C9N6L0_9FUNG|nr:endonuclease and reverse transcriptase activity [Mucor ambiguus]
MLAKGVIVPSQSDWCSPVILIKKPDGTFRFCVDYRKLNQVVIKDEFPLPLIPDLLEKLRGYKYFTSMDLKSGFWQLPLNSEDGSSKRTAFQANGSLYEFTSLPYGISTGPSSFARLMSIVLKGLPRTCNFCDDILIHSRTYEEHVEDVQRVLERLNEYNLKITSKKCQWFQAEVKFLGFLVNGEGIRSNPDKVAVVKDWKTPQNKKALSRFLGFANFYHKFINNLSGKARPLYQLIKGEQPFIWGQKAQAAFRDIKQALMTLPSLVYPNPNWPYDLHCDGSNTGIGACLVQNSRPIAFASKTLSSAEQNYSTTEKECLAIVWALQHFHPYIYGATLNIYTDHIALKSILGTRLPRGRIARWIVALQEYHPYTIIHKKGILNTDADALSRLDQNNQTADIDIGSLTAKDILNLQKVDAKISVMLKEGIQKPFKWVNEMVFYQDENKLIPVIPLALIERVLNHAHNQGGHFGVDKTVARVKNIGWWDTREEDVKMWIKYCENCQVYKIRNDNNKPPLKPITATRVGQIWATDIATLTTSKHGNKYVIVIMEYLSKWAVTCALDSFDTDMIAQVLLYEVILKYGLPERIISDNGASYVSDAMTIVLQRLGISRALTSVEHPQSDGLVERFNRTLKTSIAIVAGQEPNAWCEYLPFITFAYNTAEQASTKLTPFKIMHGREAVLPLFPSIKVEDEDKDSVYKWGKFLNRTVPLIHSKAIANIKKAQEYQQEQCQGSKRIQTNYNPGDLVARRNVKLGGFPKKRWIGPWVIIRATNKDNTAYQIYNKKNPTSGSKANISDLRRWYSR